MLFQWELCSILYPWTTFLEKKVCVAQKSVICFAPRGQVDFAIVAELKTKEIIYLEITAFEFSLQES